MLNTLVDFGPSTTQHKYVNPAWNDPGGRYKHSSFLSSFHCFAGKLWFREQGGRIFVEIYTSDTCSMTF